MSILIGEVYTSKACEFVNGQFRGIELGMDNPTKTLLSTMFFQIVQRLNQWTSILFVV